MLLFFSTVAYMGKLKAEQCFFFELLIAYDHFPTFCNTAARVACVDNGFRWYEVTPQSIRNFRHPAFAGGISSHYIPSLQTSVDEQTIQKLVCVQCESKILP